MTTDAARITEHIVANGLVAILRSTSAAHYAAVTDVLVSAGVRAIEVTLTAPDALASITELATAYAGADVVIGAGTVIAADQAEACLEAGAAFLVSPAVSQDVLAAARIAGVAVYPGALTPTEILTAHRGGASAVKLFPASAVSPRYLKDVRGPFPDIAFMPTGGIDIGDIGAWLAAGAGAVGLGGPLIGSAVVDGPDPSLADRARRAVAAVAAARGNP
jgi:2-dehydro-3-deoxyphosphogluconate aldolase/(4S)-4-hydroxy-2-oxoglutarate aldolase